MQRLARLGGLRSQSKFEPLLNQFTVLAPLAGVGGPVAVGGSLGVLQSFEDLGQVDTLRGGVGGPSVADSLAPGNPLLTGSLGGGEGREGRTAGRDGLASDLGIVVIFPLGSVLRPGLGCERKPNWNR